LIILPFYRILEKISKKDLIVVYYTGHGMVNADKLLVLFPGSKLVEKSQFSGIEFKYIREQFDDYEGPMLFLLDCCYAGAAYRAPKRPTEFILAAAGQEQQSQAISSFTYELVDIIKKHNEFGLLQTYDCLTKGKLKTGNWFLFINLFSICHTIPLYFMNFIIFDFIKLKKIRLFEKILVNCRMKKTLFSNFSNFKIQILLLPYYKSLLVLLPPTSDTQ